MLLEDATTALGQKLRRFKRDTCSSFDTRELPKEEAARGRRRTRREGGSEVTAAPTRTQKKEFSMATPKMHFLGDYVQTIAMFGTTDSYSTQIVSHWAF